MGAARGKITFFLIIKRIFSQSELQGQFKWQKSLLFISISYIKVHFLP